MTQQEFIKRVSNEIILATNDTPLFPSVKMAQAALESGWGKHTIGTANNLFGIKATGSTTPYWKGDVYNASTKEVIKGNTITITDGFRAYSTLTDSIRDHSHLLLTLSRYQKVKEAKTPEEQAHAIKNCGYATDPNYAIKLINIINLYNLKELDKKKVL